MIKQKSVLFGGKMKNIFKSMIFVIVFSLALTIVSPVLANKEVIKDQPQESIQDQQERLLDEYQAALNNELINGEYEIVEVDGSEEKILSGESDAKIKALWEEISKQIDELTARPEESRLKTASWIQAIDKNNTVNYMSHSGIPYYDELAQVEYYQSNENIYTYEINSGVIVELIPKMVVGNQITSEQLSTTELQKKALLMIDQFAGKVDFETLTYHLGRKGDNYFFRWENQTKKMSSGMFPFLQVGLTVQGSLLNYVNTLTLGEGLFLTSENQKGSLNPKIGPFNEIYSNGGSKWSGTGFITWENAGYCYIYGGSWCTPKNVFWTYNDVPKAGSWSPNSNSNVKGAVFIPYNHATSPVTYSVYTNGPTYNISVDQNSWYNAWVNLNITTYATISKIKMGNPSNGLQTAWDETWVYNP